MRRLKFWPLSYRTPESLLSEVFLVASTLISGAQKFIAFYRLILSKRLEKFELMCWLKDCLRRPNIFFYIPAHCDPLLYATTPAGNFYWFKAPTLLGHWKAKSKIRPEKRNYFKKCPGDSLSVDDLFVSCNFLIRRNACFTMCFPSMKLWVVSRY